VDLSDIEKKVIAAIQGDIPVCESPYSILAKSVNINESEFIETLSILRDKGIIRRFGATLRHQKSGFLSNAMVAWTADETHIADIGKTMASFREVSHCYRRSPEYDWKFNLYTMIHAADQAKCLEKVYEISNKTGITDFEILYSVRELKKTSMLYFASVLFKDALN